MHLTTRLQRPGWLWLAAFLAVLVPCQLAVGMRASHTAAVTGDEPFYLLTAESLRADHDLDLRDQYAEAPASMRRFWDGTRPLWKQMDPTPDGRLLSPHDPGLSLLITPAYALGGLDGVRRFLVVLWAAAMAFAALLARRLGAPPWAALLAAVAVGAGPPGLVYASQVYPEGPAALCLVLGCSGAMSARYRTHRAQTAATALVVGSLVALEWLGVKYLPYALLIAGVWAWRNRASWRVPAGAGVVAAVAAMHFVWWHLHTFDGLTPYATNLVYAGEGTASILRDHLSIPDRTYRLYGLFLDARFGLFRWLPVSAVALWGVGRRTWTAAVTVAIGVLLGTFVSITIMGWWFPGRMLVAAFPALVVLVASGARRVPRTAVALGGWGLLVSAFLAVASRHEVVRLAVDPWTLGFPLAPAWLFPDFRAFGPRQVLQSLAWAAALSLVGRRLKSSGHLPPSRRELPRLPGVLRPADRHGDGQRAGHQRGLRVHVDAHQPAEGPQA